MESKLAIVTGANRGIGFEICRQLAGLGIQVVLTSRNSQKGETAHQQLKDVGLPVHYYQLDVCDSENVVSIGACIEKEFGRCDILVNNAGIFPDAPSTLTTFNLRVEAL